MIEGKVWTAARDRRLRDLLAERRSIAEIAEILDASEASIRTRMSRLGLITARGVHAYVREAILRRNAEGWRPSRIGRQVGVETYVVQTIIELYAPAEQQERAA